jgi:hypothetical protein
MLSSLMREAGDAKICVQVGDGERQSIDSVFTALNVSMPDTEERVNFVVLKTLSPE